MTVNFVVVPLIEKNEREPLRFATWDTVIQTVLCSLLRSVMECQNLYRRKYTKANISTFDINLNTHKKTRRRKIKYIPSIPRSKFSDCAPNSSLCCRLDWQANGNWKQKLSNTLYNWSVPGTTFPFYELSWLVELNGSSQSSCVENCVMIG